jgi:hypothetical protein
MGFSVKKPQVQPGEDYESAFLDEAMGQVPDPDSDGSLDRWARGEKVTDEEIQRQAREDEAAFLGHAPILLAQPHCGFASLW